MLQQKGGIGGGGCIQRVQTAWLHLGSAVDMPTYEWHYQYSIGHNYSTVMFVSDFMRDTSDL